MAAKLTPHIGVRTVDIAPGITLDLTDIGVQMACYLPKSILDKGVTLRFGPDGKDWRPDTNIGLFIQFDERFDSLRIAVPSTATGNASGDIVFSGCPNFLMQGV